MKSLFLLALTLLIAGRCWSGESKLPELAEIKLAAEQGDAKAQYQLGKSFYQHIDFENAEKWYQLAALQGLPEAESDYAGVLTLTVAHHIDGKVTHRKPNYAEAVQWYIKAVNHGHRGALISLANCYKDGQGVKQDYVEAYKLYTIADRLGNNIIAKPYRDSLILKMTSAQIADGQHRADMVKLDAFLSSGK